VSRLRRQTLKKEHHTRSFSRLQTPRQPCQTWAPTYTPTYFNFVTRTATSQPMCAKRKGTNSEKRNLRPFLHKLLPRNITTVVTNKDRGSHKTTLPQITAIDYICCCRERRWTWKITMHVTSDITNKRNSLALEGGPGLFSSWFITIHITSDITNKKRGGQNTTSRSCNPT
jgi:hypothetical protein